MSEREELARLIEAHAVATDFDGETFLETSDRLADRILAAGFHRGPKLPEEGWRPIETAPVNVKILVAYDDGQVIILEAEDNDAAWGPYEKAPVGSRPMLWAAIPAVPVALRETEHE